MNEKELRELFRDLERCGLQPLLCDTPVPLFDSRVPCGGPTMCYDEAAEQMWLPQSLLTEHPEYCLTVKGDSMKGAGIETGDKVRIEGDITAHDGDIVLASIDGEFTLKTYCQDEEGLQWLVPQNERYSPILLTEQSNARIYGRVKEIVKPAPRMKFSECMKTIRKAKLETTTPKQVTREQAAEAIREVAPMVKTKRLWYPVYMALLQKCVVAEEDYEGFKKLVLEVVPEHECEPSRVELQRMAIGSFRKPVREWNVKNAPVKGKRFCDYQTIGLQVLELLRLQN